MCSVKMNLTTKNQNKTPDTDHIKIDLLYELQLAGLFQKKICNLIRHAAEKENVKFM